MVSKCSFRLRLRRNFHTTRRFVGKQPMTIFLDLPLAVAILVSAITFAIVALNGKSNWLEGFLLIAAYAIIGTEFYFE